MPEPPWLQYQKQDWLFEEMAPENQELNQAKTKVVIGQFFEALTARLFIGEYGEVPGGWAVYPDVVIRDAHQYNGCQHDVLVETKGGGRKYGFIIDIGQAHEYEILLGEDFPFNNPDVYYAFFVHNLSNINATYKTTNELIKGLTENVLAAMVMPLNMVIKIIDWLPLCDYAKWGWYRGRNKPSRGGPGHEYFIRMSGYRIQRCINGKESVEESFNKMAPKYETGVWSMNGWAIHKDVITGMTLKDHNICDFPIMVIRDKGGWNCLKRVEGRFKKSSSVDAV